MMKLEIFDNSIFKVAFESISKIVDEVECNVDSEGFHLNAIDRSHICFVSLDLHKGLFDTFICEAPQKICLDTSEFIKILKRAKKDDVLGLSVDENNLIITLKSDVDRKFKIRVIDIEYDTPTPPSIDVPCLINVPSSIVKDALTDMKLFSDKLFFLINQEFFVVDTNGEFGDANFQFLHGESGVNEVAKSSFSIPKLEEIFSASKFSDTVEIGLGNNMPVTINFKLVTGDGELKFLLAPRIDAEDDV